mgnify:CR=1 FL=1
MKTKEELNALKNEVEVLNKKLTELSEEELEQVVGGGGQGRLEKYLKTLCPDKSQILVDNGEGKQLVLDTSLKFEDKNNAYIIPRE